MEDVYEEGQKSPFIDVIENSVESRLKADGLEVTVRFHDNVHDEDVSGLRVLFNRNTGEIKAVNRLCPEAKRTGDPGDGDARPEYWEGMSLRSMKGRVRLNPNIKGPGLVEVVRGFEGGVAGKGPKDEKEHKE